MEFLAYAKCSENCFEVYIQFTSIGNYNILLPMKDTMALSII